MCHGYKLASLNWCCQLPLLPCSDGKLNLVRWWKMFIVSAPSNMGTWNQASHDPITQPSRKLGVIVHCLARTCESPAIPQTRKCDCFARFCGCNCKTSKICHQRTKFFYHRSRVAINSTSWDYQVVPVTYYDVSITSRLAKNIESTAIFCCNILNDYSFSCNW